METGGRHPTRRDKDDSGIGTAKTAALMVGNAQDPIMNSENDARSDAREFLDRVGFDPTRSVLTQRQAEILVLRKRGYTQPEIAEEGGTSRANVANIEASARENVEKAKETTRVVRAMDAPVQVAIPAGTDIYDVPDMVYDACNEADIKVPYSAPTLMKQILDEAEDVVSERTIEASLIVSVDTEGAVLIRATNHANE